MFGQKNEKIRHFWPKIEKKVIKMGRKNCPTEEFLKTKSNQKNAKDGHDETN